MEFKSHSRNRPDEIEAFINDYRRERGVSPSMQEIADAVGISKSNVHRHLKNMEESGRVVSQGGKRGYRTKSPLIESPEREMIPIVGRISCGSPILVEEDIEGYVSLPENIFGRGTFFFLRARGDSMIEAGIDSGDLVLIRQQSTA